MQKKSVKTQISNLSYLNEKYEKSVKTQMINISLFNKKSKKVC